MYFSSTRTVVVLAFLLHSLLAFGQDPDCPSPTFFKVLGSDTQIEYGTAITQTADGNLYLAGRNGNKTFIQKTSLGGDPVWLREFQISPFEPITPNQIFEDSEGMIVGCGIQSQFAGATRGFVFRYDPSANAFLWAHPIASNNPSEGGIVEKSPGSSFVYYQNRALSTGETDFEILDLDRATGNTIPAFASRYTYLSSDKISKIISVDGSLYGLGASVIREDSSTVSRRVLMTRFDPVNGMPIWSQLSYIDTNEVGDSYGRDLVVDGDALVAAFISTNPGGGGYKTFLQKTDLNGNILWVRDYVTYMSVLKLISTPDGYLLYGNRFADEHIVLKVDKNGVPQWKKQLQEAIPGPLDEGGLTPNLAVSVADSLYFTGIATSGLTDVFFWKLLSDGTMVDSCGFVDSLSAQYATVQNPVRTPIVLTQKISTAVLSNSNVPWTSNTLNEKMLCPDCSIPNPCPEGNDFVVDILNIECAAGFVNMTFSVCELNGGALPDMSITFYNANPFTEAADKLGSYNYNATSPDSCQTLLLFNMANQLGANSTQNGFQIFAVANDFGNTVTPFDPIDFPLSDLEECDYQNNIDSIVVQLPEAPTLNLGADRSICSNETLVIDAGPGFFKYQWSNGSTNQSISVNFPGQYRLTVTDACGFRQFDTLALQVNQLPLITASGALCPGKTVTVRGYTFDQTGTFQQTIPGLNGECDTAATFFITELPYEERTEIIYFCPFQTVTLNGVVYEDSGLVLDTVPSSIGCDTVVFYFLNQLPLPFRFFNFEICPGDSVKFNGQTYFQPVGFTDTLYSVGIGCDTIAYVSIDFLPHEEIDRLVQFCPGTSVEINGQSYTQPGLVTGTIPSTNGGCDTLINYTLEWLPAPTRAETIQFCPGASVDIGGQTYTQPGTVLFTIPGTGGGCDTLITYTLEYLPSPTRAETISFCPGTAVNIAGNTYTQPGTVLATIPGAPNTCDTLVTYTLQFGPLPTRSETLEFCQGESIVLGGQTYTQPTTVTLTLPGTDNDCDTIVTYQLQFLSPGPSVMSLVCPATINVATTPGTGAIPITYNLPIVASDCDCPGGSLNLSSGLASGSSFPVGTTQVCYAASDACGSQANCCFNVTVREELPCDVKTVGCMKYELLGITSDPEKRYTYRIRVTNNCANKLIYTAIQLPDGLNAVSPANNSIFTSAEGRKYAVRNPNYSPFYSIRFKTTTDSIANGGSDVFEYTLPAQANPTFIHITSRLATQNFYEAHLNTFNCPVGTTTSQNRSESEMVFEAVQTGVLLFPNPSNGELFADLSRWQGEGLNIQLLDSRGQRVQVLHMNAESEAQAIPLSSQLATGLYFLEIVTEDGEREVARFVLER